MSSSTSYTGFVKVVKGDYGFLTGISAPFMNKVVYFNTRFLGKVLVEGEYVEYAVNQRSDGQYQVSSISGIGGRHLLSEYKDKGTTNVHKEKATHNVEQATPIIQTPLESDPSIFQMFPVSIPVPSSVSQAKQTVHHHEAQAKQTEYHHVPQSTQDKNPTQSLSAKKTSNKWTYTGH